MTRPAAISVQTLAAGECGVMRAGSGSRWTVTGGRVRLTEPLRELGERMVAVDVRLTEGASHVIESGGWVTLQALTASRLVVEPAALPCSDLWLRWRHRLSRVVLYKPA